MKHWQIGLKSRRKRLILKDLERGGAKTAKAARAQLEKSTGKPVVSASNAKAIGTRQLLGKKKS